MPSYNDPEVPPEAGNSGSAESTSGTSAENESEANQLENRNNDVQNDADNENVNDVEDEGSEGEEDERGEDEAEEMLSSDDDSSDIAMTDSDSDMSDAEVSEEDNNEPYEDIVLHFMSIPGEEMQQFLSQFSRVMELLSNFASRPFPDAHDHLMSVLGDLDGLLSYLMAIQSGQREE